MKNLSRPFGWAFVVRAAGKEWVLPDSVAGAATSSAPATGIPRPITVPLTTKLRVGRRSPRLTLSSELLRSLRSKAAEYVESHFSGDINIGNLSLRLEFFFSGLQDVDFIEEFGSSFISLFNSPIWWLFKNIKRELS